VVLTKRPLGEGERPQRESTRPGTSVHAGGKRRKNAGDTGDECPVRKKKGEGEFCQSRSQKFKLGGTTVGHQARENLKEKSKVFKEGGLRGKRAENLHREDRGGIIIQVVTGWMWKHKGVKPKNHKKRVRKEVGWAKGENYIQVVPPRRQR